MARPKARKSKIASVKVEGASSDTWTNRLNFDFKDNRSLINLVLGLLVIVVLGILLFNFFTKSNQNQANLGPSQQTETLPTGDVSKDKLPGKYTVKEGDTLFLVAQKYYDDGYKYSEIASANKLNDPNRLEVGQELEIPKLEQNVMAATNSASPSASIETEQMASGEFRSTPEQSLAPGTGGATNQTIWGERITSDTYTVQSGDWLSKIAGRAYGDIMAFSKIAQANNISNPDLIEVGTVLKIPR